jgi:PAS domain S-box-containing protein
MNPESSSATSTSRPPTPLSDDPGQLRTGMRDLIALGGLQALWSGRDAAFTVESFADALLSILHAEVVLLRWHSSPGRERDILRTASLSVSSARAREITDHLVPLLAQATTGLPMSVPRLPGMQPMFASVVALGPAAEHGALLVASSRSDFPGVMEMALLRLGAAQLVSALRERRLFDQSRVAFAQRESDQRLRAAFEHASVGMAVTSLDGRYLQVNAAFCSITGYTEAELLATTFQDISHPEDLPFQQASIQRMLSGENSGFDLEKRFVAKGGGVIWVQSSFSLSRDFEGRPEHLVILAQDISSRRRAEDALRVSERRFRGIFDQALEAMLIADNTRQCVEANPAACVLLGRTHVELVGMSLGDLAAAGQDFDRTWREFRQAGRAHGEWRFIRSDGSIRDVEYSATADFTPGLHLAVMRDITDRKAVKSELDRKSELLQTIFDNIPVMISFAGPEGRIEWVNREWERSLGWSLSEVRSRDVLAELFPDPGLSADVLQYIRRGSHEWRDFPTRVRDGRIRTTAWANVLLSDGRTIGIGQDVTDRKLAEADRERRAHQLQGLADAALAMAAAGSVEAIARVVANAGCRITGARSVAAVFSPGDERGEPIRTFAHAGGPSTDLVVPLAVDALARAVERPFRLTRLELERRDGREEPGLAVDAQVPAGGWLCVPLIGQDESRLGLIHLAGRSERDFGDDDEAMMVQLAHLATQAVENSRLLEEVRAGQARLEALSRRLVGLQEEERRTIARDLHDQAGQILVGLKFALETVERRGAISDLTQLKDVAIQLLERVTDLSLNLRPPMLDDLGLIPTLLWHFERYRVQTRIHVQFHHSGNIGRLPPDVEITAFRVIQEGLTNVARHAGVEEVAVELNLVQGRLKLRVEDGGRGFDVARLVRTTSGLAGMKERMFLSGGTLSIDSRTRMGTRLEAELPVAGEG